VPFHSGKAIARVGGMGVGEGAGYRDKWGKKPIAKGIVLKPLKKASKKERPSTDGVRSESPAE